MLTLSRGAVTNVTERADGLIRLEVDGRPCVAYPRLTGAVAVGDDVVVNVQAAALGLGSGGFDVLHVNLTRGLGLPPRPGAHVMKLPYTPLQHAVRHAEEDGPGAPPVGVPIVCCSLHSQVAPVCGALGAGLRVAYVQLPGGSLAVSLSDALRTLRACGAIEASLAPGPAFDADVACASLPSAFEWCGARSFDVVICALGPGIAGTGTPTGHGGVEVAVALNAAAALGAVPIIAPRVSTEDPRGRHRGLSHHTRAILTLALGAVRVPWPAGLERPADVPGLEVLDVSGWEAACAGLPLSHMGRGPADDPWFFAAAFAAGRLARAVCAR